MPEKLLRINYYTSDLSAMLIPFASITLAVVFNAPLISTQSTRRSRNAKVFLQCRSVLTMTHSPNLFIFAARHKSIARQHLRSSRTTQHQALACIIYCPQSKRYTETLAKFCFILITALWWKSSLSLSKITSNSLNYSSAVSFPVVWPISLPEKARPSRYTSLTSSFPCTGTVPTIFSNLSTPFNNHSPHCSKICRRPIPNG